MVASATKLQPRTDMSVRTMLARLEGTLTALEDRTNLRFDTLVEAHEKTDGKIAGIESAITDIKVSIGTIQGERTAERRNGNAPMLAKKLGVFGSIAAAVSAVVGVGVAIWHFIVGTNPVNP
jgi:hypothetical protein